MPGWTSPSMPVEPNRRSADARHGGRRVHPRQLRRDVRRGRRLRPLRPAPRPAGDVAAARRRQALDLRHASQHVSTIDLTPRNDTGAPPPGKRRRRWAPLVVLALVLVAGGVIVTQFLRSAVDYYCNVDEIGSRGGCEAGRRLRVQGTVDKGTVATADGITTFAISFGGKTLPVRYEGQPGGIFEECEPVVVHGELVNGT